MPGSSRSTAFLPMPCCRASPCACRSGRATASSLIDIVVPLSPPPPPPAPDEPSKAKGEPSPPNLKAVPSPVVAPPLRIASAIAGRRGPGRFDRKRALGRRLDRRGARHRRGRRSAAALAAAGRRRRSSAQRVQGGSTIQTIPSAQNSPELRASVASAFHHPAQTGASSGCEVVKSSGSAELDGTTCRLIERRFRYRPARDAQGRAIAEDCDNIVHLGNQSTALSRPSAQ